ncbi:hypothetical protein AXE80_03455 [Wenyingzhuangia fucanilytica]|uniref:Anti-sigma factor n=1 Tax=Wenyingzhuangia fucanilytica TaxID=1790137 RepID=A0A1B1Y3Q1_9FLAO|nr:FecR family protein [Wenyingzhuangia fucanilytica]ANW95390.1 hypothetical protein AXE80_03455 [Wenyingzhuangia fucanilytica]
MKELFRKYLRRECSQKEIEQIVAYLKSKEDLSDIPTFEEVSKLLETYPDIDEGAGNKIYDNIIKNNPKKSVLVKKLQPFWKYAAAAIFIGFITTSYLFKNEWFVSNPEAISVTASNDIQPGKSKAILTLGDGSVVVLDEGKIYQDEVTNSDGEQIVYQAKEKNISKKEFNYLTIPRGGKFLITLSDGTKVWLNSESQLKYPTTFEKGEVRVVELVYGEAYFDVSPSTNHHGAKFVVLNQSQKIEVLGTEFNVKAYKGDANICTTLVEGKVKVNSGAIGQELKPSEQIKLNVRNQQFSKVTTVDVYNEISWKEGVFSFRKKSLLEISKVLSRWYDVDMHFENTKLKNKGFNGVLGKDQNLIEILDNLKRLHAIQDYKIIEKTIMIK